MKIMAGRFGGRKIKTSKNLPYRPTKSLVRKSLFDHLTPFKYNLNELKNMGVKQLSEIYELHYK